MKNIISIFVVLAVVLISTQAQPVSSYVYKLNNGITVKNERCWNQVWVQQSYAPMNEGDKTSPLNVNIRALGDLISGSEFKLLSSGKEVKMQGAAPGNYDLQVEFQAFRQARHSRICCRKYCNQAKDENNCLRYSL